MEATVPEPLADAGPTTRLVYLTLRVDGPLTQAELSERTQTPQRTVRDALQTLRDGGYLSERPHLRDTRQTLYDVTPTPETGPDRR